MKFSGPRLAYSVCKKVILQVGRGPYPGVSQAVILEDFNENFCYFELLSEPNFY
jgi:hypothetical protein